MLILTKKICEKLKNVSTNGLFDLLFDELLSDESRLPKNESLYEGAYLFVWKNEYVFLDADFAK